MTDAKILIVSENVSMSYVLDIGLSKMGYDSYVEDDAYEAYERILREDYDLVMLDTKLTDLDVIDICHRVKEHKKIPIIMFAENKNLDELVNYLDSGVDDYVAKPFDLREIYARIERLLREYSKSEEADDVFFQDMVLQPKQLALYVKDEYVSLTAREFALLLYLVKNKNRIISREEIINNVWGQDKYVGLNNVDVYIRYLRKKIDKRFNKKYIYTARMRGYLVKDN